MTSSTRWVYRQIPAAHVELRLVSRLDLLSAGGVMMVFFLQVETMHDFEAANSDELELNRGDVVLVVPTASVEDQVRSVVRKERGWRRL